MPVSIINRNLLKPERIAVSSEGDLVVLNIAGAEIKMPYTTAFQLSQWLRLRAKEAKRRAGDTAHHWSAMGILQDISQTRG